MVALQNSRDEKQLWTDLINQLNSVYDCFSFVGQHRVAGVKQRRGPELPVWGKGRGTAPSPSLPTLTSKAKSGVNGARGDEASGMAWHCLPHSALPSQPVTAQSTAVTSEVSLRVRFILGIQTWVLSMQEDLYHFQDFCWLTLQLAGGCRGSFCSAYMVFAIVSLAPFKITACLLDRNEQTGKAILSLLISNWSPATLENELSLTPFRASWPVCTHHNSPCAGRQIACSRGPGGYQMAANIIPYFWNPG